jgi:hypothetical protein
MNRNNNRYKNAKKRLKDDKILNDLTSNFIFTDQY